MLTLPRRVYDEIVHRARGADVEVCGVLAGDYGAEESRVVDEHPAANAAATPATRYRIDPEDLLAILEAIGADGREVVGFYHSHPTGPTGPSETDAERATWTGYSYAICALDGYPYLGSWRWDGAAFRREAVAVVDGA
ncbi:MAG: desampylase [Haloferacaceae archaeon]